MSWWDNIHTSLCVLRRSSFGDISLGYVPSTQALLILIGALMGLLAGLTSVLLDV